MALCVLARKKTKKGGRRVFGEWVKGIARTRSHVVNSKKIKSRNQTLENEIRRGVVRSHSRVVVVSRGVSSNYETLVVGVSGCRGEKGTVFDVLLCEASS